MPYLSRWHPTALSSVFFLSRPKSFRWTVASEGPCVRWSLDPYEWEWFVVCRATTSWFLFWSSIRDALWKGHVIWPWRVRPRQCECCALELVRWTGMMTKKIDTMIMIFIFNWVASKIITWGFSVTLIGRVGILTEARGVFGKGKRRTTLDGLPPGSASGSIWRGVVEDLWQQGTRRRLSRVEVPVLVKVLYETSQLTLPASAAWPRHLL